jgi:hypothetical protein
MLLRLEEARITTANRRREELDDWLSAAGRTDAHAQGSGKAPRRERTIRGERRATVSSIDLITGTAKTIRTFDCDVVFATPQNRGLRASLSADGAALLTTGRIIRNIRALVRQRTTGRLGPRTDRRFPLGTPHPVRHLLSRTYRRFPLEPQLLSTGVALCLLLRADSRARRRAPSGTNRIRFLSSFRRMWRV